VFYVVVDIEPVALYGPFGSYEAAHEFARRFAAPATVVVPTAPVGPIYTPEPS